MPDTFHEWEWEWEWESELRSRLSTYSTMIFAGLVKNAGKTTALNAVNALYQSHSLGLTSIGYDGESQDAIYHHPKPSIAVQPGNLILTAERFLPTEFQSFEILERWGQHSQFGAWLILKITEPGNFRMAGPSTLPELLEGISRLMDLGATQIHIDGALNRLSHISLEGLPGKNQRLNPAVILSTGAALGNSLQEVTERTLHVLELFQLPKYEDFDSPPEASSLDNPHNLSQILSIGSNAFCEEKSWSPLPSFLWNQDLKSLLPSQVKSLYLKGALTDSIYFALRAARRLPEEFITRSPAHILLSPQVWSGLKSRGIKVKLLEQPHLLLLTLNPWHPLVPISTEILAEALLPKVSVPLADIQKQYLWLP